MTKYVGKSGALEHDETPWCAQLCTPVETVDPIAQEGENEWGVVYKLWDSQGDYGVIVTGTRAGELLCTCVDYQKPRYAKNDGVRYYGARYGHKCPHTDWVGENRWRTEAGGPGSPQGATLKDPAELQARLDRMTEKMVGYRDDVIALQSERARTRADAAAKAVAKLDPNMQPREDDGPLLAYIKEQVEARAIELLNQALTHRTA
jgi:hypothetical protein